MVLWVSEKIVGDSIMSPTSVTNIVIFHSVNQTHYNDQGDIKNIEHELYNFLKEKVTNMLNVPEREFNMTKYRFKLFLSSFRCEIELS